MTKKELSQLYNLNREIEMYHKQLEALERALPSGRMADTVKGSSPIFPYTKRVFAIDGISETRQRKKVKAQIDETIDIIENLQDRAAIEYKRLMREIGDAPDSITRQVLTYRYVNGLPWQQVAACIGGKNTAEAVRKIAERYIISTAI